MTLIDLDKFIASFITAMKEHNPRAMSIPSCIKEALYKQGLTYHDGQIVKSQRRVSAESKENGYGESEDERIRKATSIYLDWLNGRKDCAPRGEYSIRDMVAWLEKQGSIDIDIESMVSSYKQRLKSQGQGNLENNPLINMCVSAFKQGVENTLEELNLKKL